MPGHPSSLQLHHRYFADAVFEGVNVRLSEGEPAGAFGAAIAGVRALPAEIAALGLAPEA